MIGAAIYVVLVGVFLSVGAWFAERILASLRWPRRGAWLAAMILSVAVPVWHLPGALPDMSPVQLTVPPPSGASGTRHGAARANPLPTRRAPTRPSSRSFGSAHRFWTTTIYERLQMAFLAGWGVLSAGLILRLIAGGAALRRRARQWTVTVLDGVTFTVANDLGPAVLGILHPRIVVPQWLLEEPAARRAAVLAHEGEHLRAHDGRCALAGLLLVVLLPWNLPLWWIWRRLRLAVEVDCDARVVRGGAHPAAYGNDLLAIATRAPPAPRAAIGLFEQRSQLARRIRILVSPSRRWWRWAALPFYAFPAVAALAAATFPAPPIDAALGARNQAHQSAVMTAEERALDARVAGRLLTNGRPDALAAAAVLGWPWPDDARVVRGRLLPPSDAVQRLAWLARAVAEAPERRDLVMLEKDFCQEWQAHCESAALDARLRALDPDNGAAWLDALAAAAQAKDRTGIDAALAAIGRTTRVDTYGARLFSQLVGALHQMGGEDFNTAYSQVHGISGGEMALDATIAFSTVCNWNVRQLTTRRLTLCRNAGVAFEHGDSFLLSETGSAVAMRLWPVGTPEQREAAALHRRLDYMESQSQWLLRPPGHRLQTLLELFDGDFSARIVRWSSKYPSEQEVLQAQLTHVGLNPNPPPGWKDPYN
jgi:hypothetical protein